MLIDTKGHVRFVENGVILSGNTASHPEVAVSGLKEQLDFLLKEHEWHKNKPLNILRWKKNGISTHMGLALF